jgi:hypothetical protein
MLLLHRVERERQLAEVLGRGEHAQRVTGRRRIDDQHRLGMLLRQLADVHPRHQLVDAGQRQLEQAAQLFAIEVRAAVADLQEEIEVRAEEAAVEHLRIECFDAQENDLARALEVLGGGSGQRGLADSAFAAEEDDLPRRDLVERRGERVHRSP